ncbi:P-loop containing nucleoside triphosphate hydrolase protein [Pelagophyceae sp. CCMP2097]|nr:P-loop containing nucleoside triphosphate hydrolase protein [Pelagophyceae sp. CCMP2097]
MARGCGLVVWAWACWCGAGQVVLDAKSRTRLRDRVAKAAQRRAPKAPPGMCSEKLRAGGEKLSPKGATLAWREGRPTLEGADCITFARAFDGPLVNQTVCRPTTAALQGMQAHAQYWSRIVRRANSAAADAARSWPWTPGASGDAQGLAADGRCGWFAAPSLVIIGAQKSGSTALAGYLVHHPQLRFGAMKEVHFFDKNESQCKGALPYLFMFPKVAKCAAAASTVAQASLARFLTAEATPFYLADKHACARISMQLPDAKLVMLVREPVSRAFSEYEMKHRRVDAQNDFLAALVHHSPQLLRCLFEAGPRNVSRGLAACAPQRIREDAKFRLFADHLAKQAKKSLDFTGWLRSCFSLQGGPASKSDADMTRHVFGEAAEKSVRFLDAQCFKPGRKETLQDLETVMRDEVADLRNCALKRFGWADPLTMDDAAAMIEECVSVRTGISIQYIYRGLYAAQAARCTAFGSVLKRNVLVVDQAVLRGRPQEALDRVSAFVGVKRHVYDPALLAPGSEALQKKISETWPNFEDSGWQLSAKYTHSMPVGLKRFLKSFFRPHNRLFYDWAGQDFGWDDDAG